MTALSRRRFLQAAAATSAVGATMPQLASLAGAEPLAPDEGMLVVLTLRGGCDPLSVLVPRTGARRAEYEAARGGIAIGADSLLPATDDHGLSPHMPLLADRYATGDVALLDGVAMPPNLRSHFKSTDMVQSATVSPSTTGWVGRHLDGYADRRGEIMSVAVDPVVPLHMRGAVNQCAALPPGVGLWGGAQLNRHERAAADAVRAFSDASLDRGPWADEIAATGAYALDKAAAVGTVASSVGNTPGVYRDMELAAHVLNADIGTRVVAVETPEYDTHSGQNRRLTRLLGQLDQAIDHFFATLSADRHDRVMVLVVSEFGRMVPVNSSNGTDHGHGGIAMAIGPNVAGGLHSEHPSIANPGPHGALVPTVDIRQVYGSVIDDWLAGDSVETLGGQYRDLALVAAPPGSAA